MLELLDLPVAKPKNQTLDWLRSIAGELSSDTLKQLEATLPWYREMPASRRASVGVVAQSGITSFVSWYENPKSQPWVAADVFEGAPRELLRSISLQQTLQLIRVVVSVVEERVLRDDPDLRDFVLLYSREIAFSAADVYARAAEARGLWDARLEALVVDSILTGDNSEELASRVAALGWRATGAVTVLLGNVPAKFDADALRRAARKIGADVLIGIHGKRLIVVVGLIIDSEKQKSVAGFSKVAEELASQFDDAQVVIGPAVKDIGSVSSSAKAALSAYSVLRASSTNERIIHADELLAERALAGDALAKQTLITKIYLPLKQNSVELKDTLVAYLESGRSLEATAKILFVHPNTVRYRLKRLNEVIGWDPTGAREGFVLQVAMVLGAMNESEEGK